MLREAIGLSIRAHFNAVHCLRWIAFRRYWPPGCRRCAELSLVVSRPLCDSRTAAIAGAMRGGAGLKMSRCGHKARGANARASARARATPPANEFRRTWKKKFNQNGTFTEPLLPPSLPRQRFFRLPFAYPLTYRPCESDRRSIIAYNSVHCDTRWSSSGEIQ